MGITNAVKPLIAQAMIGESITVYNNANAYIGVGNSNTAFDAAQTDLQGASKLRKGMDATYPQRSGSTVTFRATFGASEANFAWQEWGIFNAASGGTMLNRYVENLGTKTGGTWVLTVQFTF